MFRFSTLPLSAKIAVGFAATVLITVIIGWLAIHQMRSAAGQATIMSEQDAPEAALSAKAADPLRRAMLEIRTYGLTGNESNYQTGLKAIEELKEAVAA